METKPICAKIDNHSIPKGSDEIRLFVIARNETLRLPYFLKYYTKLGVDRFFLIDNNSTDNTREIALNHKNLHLFRINESYQEHWNWMEYFLNEYGKDRWCLVVDVDELLYFPYSEDISIKQLIPYLENNNYTALRSVLLDVYSDKAIVDTKYEPGTDPIKVCPFFDPQISPVSYSFLDKKEWKYFSLKSYFGGSRARVFNNDYCWGFILSKISLFKYTEKSYLVQGMHAISNAKIADIEGAVFHTKFLSDFRFRASEESEREEHYDDAFEYKIYNEHFQKNEKLTMKDKDSIRFKNTEQLIDIGIMTCSEKYRSYVNSYYVFE